MGFPKLCLLILVLYNFCDLYSCSNIIIFGPKNLEWGDRFQLLAFGNGKLESKKNYKLSMYCGKEESFQSEKTIEVSPRSPVKLVEFKVNN